MLWRRYIAKTKVRPATTVALAWHIWPDVMDACKCNAVNQALATLAVNGVSINLVTFMRVVMQLDNANAAKHVSNWSGTTYVFSIVGAIIADSYWGRYKSCIIFQLIFLAVTTLLLLLLSSLFS